MRRARDALRSRYITDDNGHIGESSEIVVPQRVPQALAVSRVDEEAQGDGLAAVLMRRWRPMVLVSLLVGAVTVSAVWLLVHPKYEVTATLRVAPFVRPILFSDYETDISRRYREYLATVAITIVSPAIVDAALTAPEVRSIPLVGELADPAVEIAAHLTAEQVKGTQLLKVSMVGEDRDGMVLIINSVLASYLRYRETEQRRWDEKILSSLRTEQINLQAKLDSKIAQLRDLAADDRLGAVEQLATLLGMRVAELQNLLADADKRRAVAQARLDALGTDVDTEAALDVDRAGFESYAAADAELQTLKEQIRTIELSALFDEREGRGTEHPDVLVTPRVIGKLQERIDERKGRLREEYLDSVRRGLEAELLDAQVAESVYTQEIKRVTKELTDVSGGMSVVAAQRFKREDLQHERENLEADLSQVRQKTWNVEVEQNRAARITIDSPAGAPKLPNVDKRLKYSVAAFLFSLMMGAAVALLRDRLNTSVCRPEEVPARLGMRLLGSVGRVSSSAGTELTYDERIAAPMRGICAAMVAAHTEKEIRTRLITSPTPRNGKSSMAINLARTLASAGKRVLLVDGDNDGQAITRRFRLSGRPGLKELLDETHSAADTIQGNHLAQIQVLPAGRHDERFGELLTSSKARVELRSVFESFDEVIVDSPPVLAGSDAVVLATLVDGVVLVLRAGQSTREEAESARFQLEGVGSSIVGVILNDVDTRFAATEYQSSTSKRWSEPTSVDQRRAQIRISMANFERSTVECHEASADRMSCPINATRFAGYISDLSHDGMGLVVENGSAPGIQTGTECFVAFNLPEDPNAVVLLGEVRGIRQIRVRATEAKLLGLRFVDAPEVNYPADMERLGRFVSRSTESAEHT